MCEQQHEDMTAEEVVEAYLTKAFNMVSVDEVTKLISYTSGNLKQALEEADASTIDQIFIQKKYLVDRFSFIERNDLTPREVVITYHLSYQEVPAGSGSQGTHSTANSDTDADENTDKKKPDGTHDALIHIENSLNLIRKEGAWFITDVIGGQTTIDFLIADEIVPSSTSSP